MTVTEYFGRRTEILQRHLNTDIKLVSPENVEEVFQMPLSYSKPILSCPYCLVFLSEGGGGCQACPAATHNSICAEEGSTLRQLNDLHDGFTIFDPTARKDLENLVDLYNQELEEGKTNGIIL